MKILIKLIIYVRVCELKLITFHFLIDNICFMSGELFVFLSNIIVFIIFMC